MITQRTFQVSLGNVLSESYEIKEGLPQGMVNSPYLFNIFTADIINACEFNTGNKSHSIAFADDLVIYVAGNNAEEVHNRLNPFINQIYDIYNTWNLKINPSKSETIVFSKPARFISKNKRTTTKDFAIIIKERQGEPTTQIPTKNVVKYLGVHIDKLLKCNTHLEIQLNKVKKAFKALHHLFHNKHLSNRATIICYLLLIRPLITYAIPIWWNTSANQMEKLRSFERSCLRSIMKMFKTLESDYTINFSNKDIYNNANIPRIDNFL